MRIPLIRPPRPPRPDPTATRPTPNGARPARVPAGRWLAAALAATLVAAGIQAAGAAPALAAAGGKGAAPAPVSNAFAMGGGVGGSIDQRTGAFEASVPLVNIAGRAGTGLSLSLSYDQTLAAQGAAGDRFGLGAGWSLGVPWVNTAGGVHVYPASGGSYAYDTSSPTGLAQYPLRDLVFARNPGVIPARPGVAGPQPYVYTLTELDGTVDRFDANGNLVEQADRFGNPIDITWQQAGQWWQPASVVDNYGQVTKFDYSTPGEVKVIAPPSAEKITATATLRVGQGRLVGVTDPLGQQTSFGYSPVTGLTAQLLSSVVSPTGAHTVIRYTPLAYEPDVVVVNTVNVTDPAGVQVLAERHFDIDPPGNSGRHNYTGYPSHVKTGSDGLFTSGDFGYRYTTELSDGTSTVDSTYNSLHLLVEQKIYLTPPGGAKVLNQTQTYAYPPVTSVNNLPANYAKPISVTVVYGNPTFGATRTVTTGSAYNDQGELTSATNAAGTTTTTTYGSYGLPATQTVTGTGGAASISTDTPTSDGKSIATATTATGATAATATARTVATYAYNDFGQVTGETVAWAKGAEPAGDSGGPNQIDDTQTISVDTAAHTATDVVTTAAGTPSAASTTTVTDLVTGQALSRTAPGGLTTAYTYDALGRPLTVTAPGGLTTTTAYPTPLVTDTTAPGGLVTQTATDVTGRTVQVTDNVSGEKLVANPAARTIETDHYAADGTQLTTTTPAGTTTTTFDPLGRPVSVVQPGGITQTETYNDAQNTQTVSLLPAGANPADPVSVTTGGFDNLNQPVSSATSYPDGTPQAPAAETYDGLDRVASYSAGNLTATPDYAGAGGLQDGTTLTPADTASFPGQPIATTTGNTMTGALTVKTLTEQAKTGGPGTAAAGPATGTSYTYNAAGQVATATDPAGHTTSYTYTSAGQIATIKTPSGAVTTYSYDPGTGRLARTDVRAADGRAQDTGYTYDPATGQVKSVYDPADPADAISYDYDADGHIIAVHYPDGTSTAATYDDNGQLATTTDITGAVTSYTYNSKDGCGPTATDLCQAVQARDGATLASVAYTYDSLNRVHTITRGNKVTTTLAYTDASQVKTETVTAADGTMLRADDYTYDAHGNVATHTISTILPAPAEPGRATGRPAAAISTTTTMTTAYTYDAYNRLLSSTVYPGATADGTATTVTTYTVDAGGDVTGQDTTTGSTTTHTVNTIDGGQLTARTVSGTRTSQAFDADGDVTTDLVGNIYTYTPAGQQASVTTPAKVTTSYTYWPDGTRRTAATTTGGVTHTITYHYATSGQISNDTYTGGGPAVTASYLLAVNREARTLATTTTGTGTGTGQATAQTTGAGTGYYLTDAHGSVTAMIDDNGQATAVYAYGDYGQPAGADPALLPAPATDPAGNAAVNPFTYDGAYTNPASGTQYLPARTYDPGQGRFLSLDAAAQVNRYQAYNTNPITNTDPTGQLAVPQILTDAFATALFIAFGFLSGGAAAPVFIAVAAGEEIAGAAIASAVLNAVSAVTNIAAAGTSAVLTADDAGALTGNSFLSDSSRENLETATFALGTVAGLTGAGAGVVDSFEPAEEAVASAATDTDDQPAATSDTAGSTTTTGRPTNLLATSEDDDSFFLNSSDRGAQAAGQADDAQADALLDANDRLGSFPPDSALPPLPADPPIAQFDQAQDQAGQSPDLNADTPPLAVADGVPGNPEQTNPGIVATTATPNAATTSNGIDGPNPLAEVTAVGVQDALSSNTTEATPGLPDNPLNVSPPSIGIGTGIGLSSSLLQAALIPNAIGGVEGF
jgi:RHS repeat-associated protein